MSTRISSARVGFVGLGEFATELAKASQRAGNISIVKCHSPWAEERQRFSQRFDCVAVESFELIRDDPMIDAVILATPNHLHCPQTLALAKAGKHIFVEKPMCNTVEEAHQMMVACQRAGVILAVGHQERRSGAYRRLRQMVQSGAFGTVHSFQASHCGNLLSVHGSDDWRFKSGQGGGPIHHKGIHKIDLLLHFFGPVEAVTTMAQPLSFNPHMAQTTVTSLRFASGVVGSLHCGFCYNDQHLNIFGDQLISWYSGHGNHIKTRDLAWEFHDIQVNSIDELAEEMCEFADAVMGQGSVETDGRVGAEAVAVATAAVLSERQHAQVYLEQVLPDGWDVTSTASQS